MKAAALVITKHEVDMAALEQSRYFGVDLAWGQRARTGLAVLDDSGRLIESTSVRTDDEIVSFVQRHATDTLVAAVDAPLVVPNDTGRRPCEALVGQLFARFGAGAYPANRGNPSFFPQPRGAKLAAEMGWDMDPSTLPDIGRRVCIEVYPHPAMVSLFPLDYVIPYKLKRGRDLSALKTAYERLLNQLEGTCGTVLALAGSARWHALRSIAGGAGRKSELDAIEDEVDAIFCAYLAWLWATDHGQMVVLGDYASGYIVTPTPPPPTVVPGRPVRRTPRAALIDLDTTTEKLVKEFRAAVPRLTLEESEALAVLAAEVIRPGRQ
jgi:predicted RNase H-like nuclease